MQQAQETVRNYVDSISTETEDQRLNRVWTLKSEVNDLVHRGLPDHTTIAEADILANLILDILARPAAYLFPPKP